MPFITDTPNRPMKPMAAETDSGVPVTNRARMPPIMAMGRTLAASRVSLMKEKFMNSSRPISSRLMGMATPRRARACCISPSSPTHSTW